MDLEYIKDRQSEMDHDTIAKGLEDRAARERAEAQRRPATRGSTAPEAGADLNAVGDTLHWYRAEYRAHVDYLRDEEGKAVTYDPEVAREWWQLSVPPINAARLTARRQRPRTTAP